MVKSCFSENLNRNGKRKKSWLYNIARHMRLLHFVVMITISSGVFLEIYAMKNPSSPYKKQIFKAEVIIYFHANWQYLQRNTYIDAHTWFSSSEYICTHIAFCALWRVTAVPLTKHATILTSFLFYIRFTYFCTILKWCCVS